MTNELDTNATSRASARAARRANSSRWRVRDAYVITLILGFIATCLGPAMLGYRTLISTNILSQFYPWTAISGVTTNGHEVCTSDTVDAAMSGIARIRFDMAHGVIASWQGIVAGGAPLLSVPDLGLLNPLSLPYWILPLSLAPAFVALLIFLTGLLGTFLFLRRLDVSRTPALLAGFIFSTSGFMVVWSNWPQVRVAAFIPMLFWSLERLVQRRRLSALVPVALVFASMVLGGFPAVTGWTIYLAVPYVVVRVAVLYGREWRAWWQTALFATSGLVLGVGIAAVQILPFAKHYSEMNIAARSGEGLLTMNLAGLLSFVAPNAFGLCIGGHPASASLMNVLNPIENVAYIGAASIVLVLVAMMLSQSQTLVRVKGIRAFFLFAGGALILLAYGPLQLHQVTTNIPVFANNFVGRMRADLEFVLAVLAGLGLERLLRRYDPANPEPRRLVRRSSWALVVLAAIAIFAGYVGLRGWHQVTLDHYRGAFAHAVWVPVALLGLAIVFVLLGLFLPYAGRFLALVFIPILIVGQGGQFFHSVLPGDSVAGFYPTTPTHRYLAAHLGENRYTSSDWTLYPATSLYYGQRTVTGHSFLSKGWQRLLQAVDPAVMVTPTFSSFAGSNFNVTNAGHNHILDQMGTQYFVTSPTQVAGYLGGFSLRPGLVTSNVVTCDLPSQPLRGVAFRYTAPFITSTPAKGVTITATAQNGSIVRTGGTYLMQPFTPYAGYVNVGIAGEDFPRTGTVHVTLRITGSEEVYLQAGVGGVGCAPISPIADGLRLVHAEPGALIYQRLLSFNRIRWASSSVVVPTSAARIALMKKGVGPSTVLLQTPAPPAQGGHGSLVVTKDVDGSIAVATTSTRAGYVLVADGMQDKGWFATVDGHPTQLVNANEAFVAAYVPAGRHVVAFAYHAPGQHTGVLVTLGSLATALVLGLAGLLRGPRHGRRGRRSLSQPRKQRQQQIAHDETQPSNEGQA